MELFRRCEVIFDYENNLIYLHRIGRKEVSSYQSGQLKDAATYTTVPIELMDNRLITRIKIGGKERILRNRHFVKRRAVRDIVLALLIYTSLPTSGFRGSVF